MSQDVPKDEKKRENVFEVLDEIISHLHTTRHLFIFLIATAFILAPLAIIMAVLLLSPPPFIQGDVIHFQAVGNLTHMTKGVVVYKTLNATPGIPVESGSVQVANLPNQTFTIASPAPRFVFFGGPPGFGHPTDLTSAILVFITISVILASIWLFIGLKEYRFFAKWNKKFSRYVSLRDKLDKELEADS